MAISYIEDFLNEKQSQLVQDLLDHNNMFFPFFREKTEGTLSEELRIGLNFTSQKIIEFSGDQKLLPFVRKQLSYFPKKLTNFQTLSSLIKPYITKTLILHTRLEKSSDARYPIFYRTYAGTPVDEFPGVTFVLHFYDEDRKALMYKTVPVFRMRAGSDDTNPFWTFSIRPQLFSVNRKTGQEIATNRSLIVQTVSYMKEHQGQTNRFLYLADIGAIKFRAINNTMENRMESYTGTYDGL
jgi:hypothetical protein